MLYKINEKIMPSKEENKTQGKRNWLATTISTLIGVIAAVFLTWYQISLNEEQTLEAEKERSKSVKNELVQIVEEHVINQRPLDISRLSRLVDFRSRQENLLSTPSVSEIIESSEFNILKSQYLEFESKQQFKKVFDGIYSELYTPKNLTYEGNSDNAVNAVLTSIQEGNNKETSLKVIKLATDFSF